MAFSTINKSSLYQSTALYTGSGADDHTISGVGFSSDFTWCKGRSGSNRYHLLTDTVRGAGNVFNSNDGGAQTNFSGLKSWNSDGFVLSDNANFNANTETFASWNWKAGTTSGIAGSPSITPSSYSFNATSGFSIIKYVGNGTAGATIPHGLGVAPSMVMIKNLDANESVVVGHESNGWTKRMKMDSGAAAVTSSQYFNDTSPTTSLVTIGSDGGVNTNTQNYIAYCFADVAGYSKFSSYTGNGNADGTFIYTGFKPAFVLIKESNGTNSWQMFDNKRLGYNDSNSYLQPNTASADITGNNQIDILSNGIKLRSSNTANNGSGQSFIYMAFGQPIISNGGVCTTAR